MSQQNLTQVDKGQPIWVDLEATGAWLWQQRTNDPTPAWQAQQAAISERIQAGWRVTPDYRKAGETNAE